MVYKSNELKGINRCTKRRARNLHLETGKKLENVYEKAAILKGVIKNAMAKSYTRADIEAEITEGFDNLAWASDETKSLNTNDAIRQVLRYLRCEDRKSEFCASKIVNPFGMMEVEIRPDFIFRGMREFEYKYKDEKGRVQTYTQPEPYVEVVKLCCKKPDITQTGKVKDKGVNYSLELYSMLLYARELADLSKYPVMNYGASFYFLRKKNDSDTNFDTDFFDTKGGGNVVTLWQKKTATLDEGIAIDDNFKPQFEDFLKGETICDLHTCEHCEFASSCYYTKVPIKIEEERKQGKVQDISLTTEQMNAVGFRKGIARINAGAGAGKTLVSALRVAYMLDEGIAPEKICMLTFTNTGAAEMSSRVKLYCDDLGCDADVDKLVSTTFNSFGEAIVQKNYKEFGFSKEPRLIDDIERFGIIARLLQHKTVKGLDYKNFNMNTKYVKGALHLAKEAFDIIKRERLSMGDEEILKDKLSNSLKNESGYTELIELYAEYDSILKEKNLMEFADQELLILDLLEKNPFYFEEFGYEHVMVDEFQDTNEIQWQILMKLIDTPYFQSFMVVGDDSQSIFSFRGSEPEFIVNFWENIGEEGQDFYLLENHRSTPQIIAFANQVNELNINRVAKDLIATRPDGPAVKVDGYWSKDEEYGDIIQKIQEKHKEGMDYEDMAFIASKRTELLNMGTACTEAGIPWIMLNPEKFLENSRVSAAVALAMWLTDQTATLSAFNYMNAKSKNQLLATKTDDEITDSIQYMERLAKHMNDTKNVAELKALLEVLDEDDEIYQDFLKKVFVRTDYDEIIQYILDYNEYGENEAKRRESKYPGIVLTTAHSSKGMEWPVVFNSITKYHTAAMSSEHTEEVRRLFFVSATRARDELYVTGQKVAYGAKGDRTYNKFLVEAYKILGKVFDTTEPDKKKKKVA